MILKQIFDLIIFYMQPGGTIMLLPFLTMMLISLASPLYTILQMLRREETSANFLLLMVPFVLFGTLAIMQPLMADSFFADKNLIWRSGIDKLLQTSALYQEIIAILTFFVLIVIFYQWIACKRIPTFRRHRWLSLGILCGEEIILGFYVLLVCLLALFLEQSALALPSLGWLQWFLYGVCLIFLKTLTLCFTLVYTGLFGRNLAVSVYDSQKSGADNLRRLLKKQNCLYASGLGLFLCLCYYILWQPLRQEGVSLSLFLLLMLMFGWLILLELILLAGIIFPQQRKVYRYLLNHSHGQALVQLLCVEYEQGQRFFDEADVIVTHHFLIGHRLFMWAIYLPDIRSIECVGLRRFIVYYDHDRKQRLNYFAHFEDLLQIIKQRQRILTQQPQKLH